MCPLVRLLMRGLVRPSRTQQQNWIGQVLLRKIQPYRPLLERQQTQPMRSLIKSEMRPLLLNRRGEQCRCLRLPCKRTDQQIKPKRIRARLGLFAEPSPKVTRFRPVWWI